MGITRRDLLKWGAGVGGSAALGSLALPSTAWGAARTTPRGLPTDDWMSRLNGDLSLLDLTIPGTHDSCCENPNYGTEWSHTQNWGVPQQLQEGVRFLDIRCNGLQGAPDELGIYHSDNYQHIRLQDVLDQCRSFLQAHPGETIVMRLRNERAGGQALGDEEFMRRVNHYLDALGFRSLFHFYGWPTLGTARGKVVLLADFTNPWGLIDWSSGQNDYFDTQDVWQISGSDPLGRKGQYIVAQFDKAFLTPNSPKMFVNFLSYAGGYWPKLSSQNLMDHAVYPYLNARTQQRARFGIVPMDFPDFHVNVLQMLIDKNFV
ncbi:MULTISPECIES: phosphatidylinositol-specific phospholipase C domain-containing protein [Streptomyces]|uniref:phosphatidylinositol-specific phospholipase C domain-containing protein n=1 Tax=Streptomyces TaxID=1883 RepID=UPI0004AAD399|nr:MULTISPECIES: phosphatidylinositol-specific phospholipase C domain-containing protein [Streptomyces]